MCGFDENDEDKNKAVGGDDYNRTSRKNCGGDGASSSVSFSLTILPTVFGI